MTVSTFVVLSEGQGRGGIVGAILGGEGGGIVLGLAGGGEENGEGGLAGGTMTKRPAERSCTMEDTVYLDRPRGAELRIERAGPRCRGGR